ncbi:MAG: betaine-aldehyde dehydrogenase [Planctomycetota bacterium]|nr:MAG: betaine-aldehyde dehydrogenase [Planctomycetota bacterium]
MTHRKDPLSSPPKAWKYSSSEEDPTLARIESSHDLWIGGTWSKGQRGKRQAVINPASGEKISSLAVAGPREVDAAVQAARAAQPEWEAMPASDRTRILFAIARILQERSREFAVLESIDNGKAISETRDFDLPLACRHFFYHAGWTDKLDYLLPGRRARALGVCAQIIPWNFPLLLAAWKLAPALAAGNSVVLKPAETSSLSALRLCEVLEEAGLPKGVVNVITGGPATGAALVEHQGIDKVAFTGSTEVGKEISSKLAGSGKKLSLELGGKGAQIVFEDAPLDQAVEGVIRGIYFNQGQICCAGSRLLVQESVRESFLALLLARMDRIRVGNPLDKNSDLGAIHSAEQLQRIQSYLALGQQEGAELKGPSPKLPSSGYWCAPGLFDHVEPSMRIFREEIFGPVLAVTSFRTMDEAIKLAGDSRYGLSAGVWTDKGSRAFQVIDKLHTGVVWANCFNRFDPSSPFGGIRESGFGRDGGVQGMAAYLQEASR